MRFKDHTQFSDAELEHQFETYRLKPALFTHEAHLRLAYIHISKYGVDEAEYNMINQIKNYAISLGVPMKFNKTVTVASVRIIDQYMGIARSSGFEGLLEEFPRIKEDFRSLVRRHYSYNVFSDPDAKKDFVPPDLLPFDYLTFIAT